ncbi:hypothetical protein EG829_02765 [bacterium]|nr:hypothetical protein [bacterium]
MELLTSDCIECRTTKAASVSLASMCRECGLDQVELHYEIPDDKFDEVMRDIFMIFDFHQLRPVGGAHELPSYEELLRKLEM